MRAHYRTSQQLGDIADALRGVGDNEGRIWKLLAYAGRYGHQPVSEAMQLTTRQLGRLVDSVAQLVREENEAATSRAE